MAFFDNGEYAVHGQGEEVVDKWVVEPELELATPEQARRREALRREAEDLRFELDTRDLAADLAAFETRDLRARCGLHDAHARALRGEGQRDVGDARRRLAPRPGQARGEGELHGDGAHASPRDHGVPPRGAAGSPAAAAGPGPRELRLLRADVVLGEGRRTRAPVEERRGRLQREGPGRGARHRQPSFDRLGRDRGGRSRSRARADRGARTSARPPGRAEGRPGRGGSVAHADAHARLRVGVAASAGEPRTLPALGHDGATSVRAGCRCPRTCARSLRPRRASARRSRSRSWTPGSGRWPRRSTPHATARVRSRTSSTT